MQHLWMLAQAWCCRGPPWYWQGLWLALESMLAQLLLWARQSWWLLEAELWELGSLEAELWELGSLAAQSLALASWVGPEWGKAWWGEPQLVEA